MTKKRKREIEYSKSYWYKTLMKEIEQDINGKCVHGLEELILLKCHYYQKSSIDSMQSLSRFL